MPSYDKQIPSIDAQLITNFVPSAFARPALRKLGIAKIPNSYFVFKRDNSPVELPLSNEHYFVVALVISEAVFSAWRHIPAASTPPSSP